MKNNFIYSTKGINNYLNMRETYLHSDFGISIALEMFYDTDLENFWTQKSFAFFLI